MIGVLMMAHGTPERLDQMEEYLSRIRGGRRPTPALVEERTGNYRAIIADVAQRDPLRHRHSSEPSGPRDRNAARSLPNRVVT